MARVTFLGTADAFNGAGRGNSCYLIEDALGMYTVDFGPTALLKCEEYGADLDRLDAVFITHLHGDHIGGIAMLLVYLQFRLERTRPLVIAGPEGMEERLALLRESAYPSVMQSGLDFPIEFVHWQIPGTTEVLGRTVSAIRAVHDRLAVASSLRVDTPEVSLCFSGDTGWQEDLGVLVDGSDLFICECSMVEADYWGHLSLEELREHRDKLNVGHLYLSHLSEAARSQAVSQSKKLNATVADDGLIINV